MGTDEADSDRCILSDLIHLFRTPLGVDQVEQASHLGAQGLEIAT